MEKVYIAGKITGDGNYRIKFAKSEQFLKRNGYIVLNPAILPEGMEPGDYMRICMAMVESADFVVLLEDWEESGGAAIEKSLCDYTGKSVYTLGSIIERLKMC